MSVKQGSLCAAQKSDSVTEHNEIIQIINSGSQVQEQHDSAQSKGQNSDSLFKAAAIRKTASPGGIIPDTDEPEQIGAQDISPVEIAVIHSGPALGEKEFFTHSDEKSDPGKKVRPVKCPTHDTAEAHAQREGKQQQGGDCNVRCIEAGDLEGCKDNACRILIGTAIESRQKLHGHQGN